MWTMSMLQFVFIFFQLELIGITIFILIPSFILELIKEIRK